MNGAQEAASYVQTRWSVRPQVALILGTGLGKLADEIEAELELPYEQIPHFPKSTVTGHAGKLVCGRLNGVPVLAMSGRCHLYEGYSSEEITLPVRIMHALGATSNRL